jgi:biopolymer transport protein TolR
MQAAKPDKVQSAINVTPLVDVVLVLLIIFMVVAPQMESGGPPLDLPTTDKAPRREDGGRQILVAIERTGAIWIDSDQVAADRFQENLADMAEGRDDWKVVIKGDSRLTFGQVKQAMLAADAAGFKDVGLIAQRRDDGGGGD